MKAIKSLDVVNVLKYLLLLFTFLVFNNLEKEVMPYSVAVYVSALSFGANLLTTPLLFIASFLISGSVGLLGSISIPAIFFVIVITIYRKFNLKTRLELAIYTAVSLIGFILIGSTTTQVNLEKRLLVSIITVLLTFVCIVAGKVVSEKGLKFKLGHEEFLSLSLFVIAFGLGLCNLVSPLVWKALSALTVLWVCYTFNVGKSSLVACVLGVSLAVYFNDLNYLSVMLIWSLCAQALMPLSRHASAVCLVASDFLTQAVFSLYGTYSTAEFLAVLIGTLAFSLFPTKILKDIKEKLYLFREKQLARESINRNRIMLSNRLYELSGVFSEMASSFNLFKENAPDKEQIKSTFVQKIIAETCKNCDNYAKCKRVEKSLSVGFSKLIEIGFAKGKLSLIDMPKELSDYCLHPNSILFGLNKMLAEFRAYTIENMNVQSGRDLVAMEANGVAEILRSLALESGALLKYHSRLERVLCDALFKKGFLISELLIYGEENNLSVGLIICMNKFSISALERTINKTLKTNLAVCERADISQDKCYFSFKKSAEYDAVFGVSSAIKDGSEKCGDTHSVTRIDGDKFLVALSDGMGSGKRAESISSASLSLIESFYKAGLKSPLILNTVNKLLAINTEDSFTALDVSIVDLSNCSADFIKYGAPYGFIVGDNGIRMVESSSLPLGILDEIKPSVCHAELNCGDLLLLVTDGVTDAFSSSGDMIDFLRGLPAKNPQTLADSVIEKAQELSDGKRNDDMTALAVRIFKKVV